ncbi:MAG: SPOR domain-containing protein [Pseudomonadota bacterium]
MSDDTQIKEDDPLAELLRLTDDPAQTKPPVEAAEPGLAPDYATPAEDADPGDDMLFEPEPIVAQDADAMPVLEPVAEMFPEPEHVAETVAAPDDLEEALLAELGEPPTLAVPTEPEPVFEPQSSELELPTLDQTDPFADIFDETTVDASEPASFEPEPFQDLPPQPSLEDELAALLGGDAVATSSDTPAADDATALEAVFATPVADHPVIAEPALTPEPEPEPELQVAFEEMEAAAAADKIPLDEVQAEFEQAIASESEPAPVSDDIEQSFVSAIERAPEPVQNIDDIDIDAMFAEALSSEDVLAASAAASVAEPAGVDVAPEAVEEDSDPLAELLDIMGDEPVADVGSQGSLEDDFQAQLDALAMPPTLDTQEINFGDEVDLSGMEIGDVDGGTAVPTEHASSLDDDIFAGTPSVAAAAVAATAGATVATSASQSPSPTTASGLDLDIDLDDAFDERRFEAELARDMEFVAHDMEMRSNGDAGVADPLLDDVSVDDAPAEATNSRGLKIAAAVGTLAIAGAVGLFMFAGGSIEEGTGPIVVEAENEPVRIRPENPGGAEVPNQDRAVFADNETGSAPLQPSLVTTSEEPVDLAGLPATDDAAKAEDRLLPDTATESAATDADGAAIAPRRVRTLVVRPDGTLEERPEPAPAPAVEEPVVAATEPAGPVTFQAPSASEPVTVGPAPTQTVAPAQVPAPAPTPAPASAAETAPAEQTASVPVRRVETQVITPSAIPPRPAEQPVNIINPQPAAAPAPAPAPATPPVQTASAPAAPAAVAPAPVATPGSPFKVQIASLPTQSAAQQTSANLLSRFRNVLGGRGVAIRQADIPGRGTFYRIQVDAASREDANSLCARYRSAGGDCLVTR